MSADDFDDPGSGTPTQLPGGFRAAVARQLSGLGYTVTRWQPEGVDVVAPGGSEQFLGLANLYRRAKAAGRAEWPRLIDEFLSHLAGVTEGPKIPEDLTTVSGQLRPRVGRPFGKDLKARPWSRPIPGTGLDISLVIDFPNTMAYVTTDMLRTTPRTGDELLAVALENLRQSTPGDVLEPVSEEIDIHIGHTGDGYDAARALLVEELMPGCPHGCWVALPSRDELVVWPVSGPALAKIHVIKMFAAENFAKHAYPVTDEVFWVRGGAWHRFGIRMEDDTLVIDAPEEFQPVMEALRVEAGGGEEDEEPSDEPE